MMRTLVIAMALVVMNVGSALAYVGNVNTYKFHEDYCSSVRQMYEHNKHYTDNREELTDMGMVPCKRCHP